MTFLQGKSTSYTRFLAESPNFRSGLDDALGRGMFTPIQDGSAILERLGTCSWRSLLDGPIDRGFLDGNLDLYACGLRRDVKRAPSQLAKAETARAIDDYMKTCGGKPDRKRVKEIGAEIRLELAKAAPAQPSHGVMLANTHAGLVLIDGPTGGGSWAMGALDLKPLYRESPERFLEWLIWAGLNEAESGVANVWPEHEVTFRDLEGDGASFKGRFPIADALAVAVGKGQWVDRARFSIVLEECVAQLTLCRAQMKVVNLEFPEELASARGPLEARLRGRAQFVMDVERELSRLVIEFGKRAEAEDFPDAFNALWTPPPAAEVPAMYDRMQALRGEK